LEVLQLFAPAYLFQLRAAYEHVRARKPNIAPNDGFMAQLIEQEGILFRQRKQRRRVQRQGEKEVKGGEEEGEGVVADHALAGEEQDSEHEEGNENQNSKEEDHEDDEGAEFRPSMSVDEYRVDMLQALTQQTRARCLGAMAQCGGDVYLALSLLLQ